MSTPFIPQTDEQRIRSADLMQRVKDAQAAWDARFSAAREEEQMLMLHAQKISLMYGLSDFDNGLTKEQIARKVLTDTFGPKFTERVLKDKKCRDILGMDFGSTPEQRAEAERVRVRTVPADSRTVPDEAIPFLE